MLIDQGARGRAIDPNRSFIVQAPAGSGKTGLLVRRILVLLGRVEKPEQILAITFTRKATAQMRERVLSALIRTQSGAQFEPHESDLRKLASEALARNQARGWQLLAQPQRLQIRTIDSLCADLVRKMPWSTSFGNMPQIETDLDALYTRAAQNLLEKIDNTSLQDDLSTLLISLRGDLTQMRTRLAAMLHQRESWLRLIFSDQGLASREQVEGSWRRLAEQAIARLEKNFGAALSLELLELARYRAEQLGSMADQQLDALLLEPLKHDPHSKWRYWRAIMDMLCTAKGEIRKTVDKRSGFPPGSEQKACLIKILGNIREASDIQAALGYFRTIPDPRISNDEWRQLDALNRVLPMLAQELYVLMAERHCTDYDELSRRAIDALGQPDQPSDLALIQDYRIKHILMDEFQDTSPTQLTLLERLTAGWQADDPERSLFLVGDPMQSIYAFRKADVRVFLRVLERGINDLPLEVLRLKVNFRSSPDLVNWVNQTLQQIFPEQDQPETAKIKFSPSEACRRSPGKIHTHLCIAGYEQKSRDYRHAEAAEVTKKLSGLIAQAPDDTIGILARKRSSLETLAQYLRAADLPFESVELETLAEQHVVRDLISLCIILLQPMDMLSWMAVLRAPWCGMSLADLTRLQHGELLPLALPENREQLPEISETGLQALNRINDCLHPLLTESRHLKLHQRLRHAWMRLRGPACYSAHQLIHVEAFFEQLSALEESGETISRARLEQLCGKFRASSPADRIKLMTIHKAKGLEFDHVFIIDLAGAAGGDNRRHPLLHFARFEQELLIAPPPRGNAASPTRANFITRHRQAIDEQELARLLYVATTRAKQQLFLYATLKENKNGSLGTPPEGSLLKLLWPALGGEFSTPGNQTRLTGSGFEKVAPGSEYCPVPLVALPLPLPPLKLPKAVGQAALEAPLSGEKVEFSWAREEARIIGLIIHRLLEHADQARLRQWETQIDRALVETSLRHFGLADERIPASRKRVILIMQNIARDQRAHWIFDPNHADVRSEWALSSCRNGLVEHHIIDRSFVDREGVRWVIDFKTSRHEGAGLARFLDEEERRYATQLNQYGRLLQLLEPHRTIHLGLYFPAIGEWRERHYHGEEENLIV